MNRMDFIKSFVALVAATTCAPAITVAEQVALTLKLPYNIPVGYVCWLVHRGESYCVLGTDKGARILEGGMLSKEEFPELFSVLEYKFGGESDNFRPPDMRGIVT